MSIQIYTKILVVKSYNKTRVKVKYLVCISPFTLGEKSGLLFASIHSFQDSGSHSLQIL
jgi:hypothetical protein